MRHEANSKEVVLTQPRLLGAFIHAPSEAPTPYSRWSASGYLIGGIRNT